MKKFWGISLCIMIFLGIIIGMGHGKKQVVIDASKEIVTSSNEVYIDELSLPLIEVDTLNPLRTKNSEIVDILSLIYEPLFEYDTSENLVKKLAYQYSKLDSKTYIITIIEEYMEIETKCLHSGYTPENGGPRVMPIYQSTTFRFNSTNY